jgi:hypothetical protein
MAYFNEVLAFAQAAAVSKDVDGLIKVAADSDVSPADIVFMHNLIEGNIHTGEGIIIIAEEMGEPILGVAADVYEYVKEAGEEYDEEAALEALAEVGLTPEDYEQVEYLLDKQAEEAFGGESEIVADEAVWEKVAEAYNYLAEEEIDPVVAMEFAENYSVAEDDAEKEAVASEFDGITEEAFDKIAEAFEYLEDIDGVALSDLMGEIDKEAMSAYQAVGKGIGKVHDALKFDVNRKSVKNLGKKMWTGYKNAVMGKGAKAAKSRLETTKPGVAKAEEAYAKARDIAKNGKPSDGYSASVKKSIARAKKKGKYNPVEKKVESVDTARKHLSRMKMHKNKASRKLMLERGKQVAAIGVPTAAAGYGVNKAISD